MTPYIVIFITAQDLTQARKISQQLLEQHLAACVNILDGVQSAFWWQGKVDSAAEVLLVVKSHRQFLAEIMHRVKTIHSYDVPEILALPVLDGNPQYLQWIDESLQR